MGLSYIILVDMGNVIICQRSSLDNFSLFCTSSFENAAIKTENSEKLSNSNLNAGLFKKFKLYFMETYRDLASAQDFLEHKKIIIEQLSLNIYFGIDGIIKSLSSITSPSSPYSNRENSIVFFPSEKAANHKAEFVGQYNERRNYCQYIANMVKEFFQVADGADMFP